MRIHYRDFPTGKLTYAVGQPLRVERLRGPLGIMRYVVVQRKNDELLIPEYSVRGASRQLLKTLEEKS